MRAALIYQHATPERDREIAARDHPYPGRRLRRRSPQHRGLTVDRPARSRRQHPERGPERPPTWSPDHFWLVSRTADTHSHNGEQLGVAHVATVGTVAEP